MEKILIFLFINGCIIVYIKFHIKNVNVFLIQEDVIKHYPPLVRVLLLSIAFAILSFIFYNFFFEDVYKLLFTDEPREPSDYAKFVLAIAFFIVIISTLFRILNHLLEARNTMKIE